MAPTSHCRARQVRGRSRNSRCRGAAPAWRPRARSTTAANSCRHRLPDRAATPRPASDSRNARSTIRRRRARAKAPGSQVRRRAAIAGRLASAPFSRMRGPPISIALGSKRRAPHNTRPMTEFRDNVGGRNPIQCVATRREPTATVLRAGGLLEAMRLPISF